MTSIIETVFIEKRKWSNFAMDYYLIKSRIIDCYKKIASGSYQDKKQSFNIQHYLKMQKDYITLKIFHDNIKKNLSNEKLLKYYESVLIAYGFNLSKL